MGLFQRAHQIMQAKANKALDAAERPDEMLDLSYEQMLDQITQVKRGLVAITGSRKQIELQEQQLHNTVEHLQEQEKLEHTLAALQQRVNTFRSQKEVLKAQYTAAKAQSEIGATAAGISTSFSDTGADIQRATDKIATMQARAEAVDELLQSGVLEDVGGDTDDIQQELEEAGTNAQVEKELAALKAELGTGEAPPQITSG